MHCIVNGKKLSWRFIKESHPAHGCIYNFFVGDIYVGKTYQSDNAWAGIGKSENSIFPVGGFITCKATAEFLLRFENIGDVK